MLPEILQRQKLFSLLHDIDVDLAAEVQARGCPCCGGPLHQGAYVRKPRGGPAGLSETFFLRHSLCCGREGCRRRTLPPSVLFLGRRVYWGGVVVVATALRQQWDEGYSARKVMALFGITRSTLRRWLTYFRTVFPQTTTWQKLCGLLMPPVTPASIPLGILERLGLKRDGPEPALIHCLRLLCGSNSCPG